MIKKIIRKIRKIFNSILRKKINKRLIKRLRNTKMTLISSNCNGCLILHDLKCQYNSPFVNLYIEAEDYIKLLENFEWYMNQEIQFIESKEKYPIGKLGDITIFFVHYKTKEEAYQKWHSRKQRIDMSNAFIMFTDRDGCTEEHLIRFDNLPYKNKIVFTHKPYPEIKSAFHIKGFDTEESVGALFEYVGWSGKKFYDDFDYVTWFNSGLSDIED